MRFIKIGFRMMTIGIILLVATIWYFSEEQILLTMGEKLYSVFGAVCYLGIAIYIAPLLSLYEKTVSVKEYSVSITVLDKGGCFLLPKGCPIPQKGDQIFLEDISVRVEYANYHLVKENKELHIVSLFGRSC